MKTIQYIERESQEIQEEAIPGKGMLKWLYNSPLGKLSLHLLVKRKLFSSLGGWFMNTSFSKKQIDKFIEKYKLDLSVYKISDSSTFKTFNEFFYREIKPESRPLGDGIVSPADGKILAFQSISEVSKFFVKGSEFSVKSFLRDDNLAEKYNDGAMVIVRLAPTDYHRFHFPKEGEISKTKVIKGNYFSVSPLALKNSLEIFCQNQRTYSILKNEKYGDILISEVGATMVGSIIQTYKVNNKIEKGQEKGYFAFGGSTLVLLFEKDKVAIDEDLLENTRKGLETTILMGEKIAI